MTPRELKLKKAASLSVAFGVGFFANKWLDSAWGQATILGKWIMIFITMLVLTGVIYIILDEDGNF